jgi:hypothetical protein
VAGPNYLSADAANEIVHALMARTEILRRTCLICGRWGAPEANRAVGTAIQSLSFAAVRATGVTNYLKLREFGASICFYWNMAGLLDRGDLDAVHALQTLKLRNLDGVNDAVMVLPFGLYQIDSLKSERSDPPTSVFLAGSFVAEARDIAVPEARGEELFDQTELMIGLEIAYRLGSGFVTPLGQFASKRQGQQFKEGLDRIEGLSDDDPFFKAGMMGGSKASAAHTIQKIRSWHGF